MMAGRGVGVAAHLPPLGLASKARYQLVAKGGSAWGYVKYPGVADNHTKYCGMPRCA